MALYCIVTSATRIRPTGIRVEYDLRDDAVTPHRIILSGNMGIELLAEGATLVNAGGQVVEMTPVQRRRWARDQVEDHFRSLIRRVLGANADADAIVDSLVQFRAP